MCYNTSELYNPTMVSIFVKCKIKYAVRGAADLPPEMFVVPRQLICSKSSYFQSLFEGSFQESHSGRARLYDVRPWVFRVFIAWLYHQAIYYVPERTEPPKFFQTELSDTPMLSSPNEYSHTSDDDAWTNETDEGEQADICESNLKDPVTWPYFWLFELYVFADKYPSREFRNDILDIIRTKLIQDYPRTYPVPYPSEINWACENLLPTNPLYQLLAHWYSDLTLDTVGGTVQEQAEKLSAVPSQFAIYCFIFAKRKEAAEKCQICHSQNANEQCRSTDHTKEDATSPYSKDPCTYHDHDGDENERAVCHWRQR